MELNNFPEYLKEDAEIVRHFVPNNGDTPIMKIEEEIDLSKDYKVRKLA
jgi:hypothetical protein